MQQHPAFQISHVGRDTLLFLLFSYTPCSACVPSRVSMSTAMLFEVLKLCLSCSTYCIAPFAYEEQSGGVG